MDDYPYRAHDLPIFSRGHKNVYRRTFSEDRPRLEEVFLAISGRPVLRSLYFLISKEKRLSTYFLNRQTAVRGCFSCDIRKTHAS